MSRPMRGVGGYRRRENDEGHGRTSYARTAGTCAQTGYPIAIGDVVTVDPVTGRTVLVKSNRLGGNGPANGR